VPLSAPVPLTARESFSADPTTARRGSFTMEQVPTILQGLQPQGGQDPGTASQGPARLAAVDVALADLGAMTGQRLTSLLGPSPSITVPNTNPAQTVTEAPITPLTSVPLLVSTVVGPPPPGVLPPAVGPPPPVGQPPVVGPPPPVPPRPPNNRPPGDCEYPGRGPHKPPRRY
jgi:hypothetical protein